MSKNSGKDKAKSATANKTIALNKRARHEYHIEERFEAGLALQGWEVKSIRAGRGNIIDAYAYVKHGEIFLIGAQITPLIQASTHVVANDRRERKLLLHRSEIDKLVGDVLEQEQDQARSRAGQGQADPRQARCRQGPRLGDREAARDASRQPRRVRPLRITL